MKKNADSIAITAACLAALFLGVSGPGTRLGLWDFRTGLGILKIAGILSAASIVICIIVILHSLLRTRRRSSPLVLTGLLLGSAIFGLLFHSMRQAQTLPMIHDITTDTQDPPAFEAIAPLRKNALNPLAYGGAEIAQQQMHAYPDIESQVVKDPPHALFTRAAHAARELGWEIVSERPEQGILEATDTTWWFGFKDDIVVRIRAQSDGSSKLDIRSLSRVGKSDVGMNARRIRKFLNAVMFDVANPH